MEESVITLVNQSGISNINPGAYYDAPGQNQHEVPQGQAPAQRDQYDVFEMLEELLGITASSTETRSKVIIEFAGVGGKS